MLCEFGRGLLQKIFKALGISPSIIRKSKESCTTGNLQNHGCPPNLTSWSSREIIKVVDLITMVTLDELQRFTSHALKFGDRKTLSNSLHRSDLFGKSSKKKII